MSITMTMKDEMKISSERGEEKEEDRSYYIMFVSKFDE